MPVERVGRPSRGEGRTPTGRRGDDDDDERKSGLEEDVDVELGVGADVDVGVDGLLEGRMIFRRRNDIFRGSLVDNFFLLRPSQEEIFFAARILYWTEKGMDFEKLIVGKENSG